jgi:condensin complex subunit 1
MLADFGVQALRDKSSSVRKAAIALLTRLILTHPYGVLHGGDLDEPEWTARLAVVDAELKTYEGLLDLPNEGPDEENEEESEDDDVEDSLVMATPRKRAERRTNKRRSSAGLDLIQGSSLSSEDAEKVMRLRLTRRYYADALHFIAQLSGAMDELVQLLVSKSKAEVLESMEFFRVAHEYRLPGATVGVRKMVHLIWTKDNALVMEDGAQLKGIRSRLLEVYRALYFEPLPDLSPRDNVARIARNMVERTFGATLAELTSLEELLRTMCAEDMVHPDVVNKLWAVYGAPRAMPRAQRRGAIIVLSMLAVARREIVADHIEALLGVGLGPLGARDIVLAKYTCVALARVGGSIKKVKGALSDEQVRFPMTHPMFAKLRAAVMWQNGTAANGEWFSLAENAIQTIYQLGEQPDALCAEIVKSMTARVFGPRGPTLVNEEQEGSVRGLSPLREDAEDEESTSDGARTPAQRPGSPGGTPAASAASEAGACSSKAPAFGLAQLLFVVGHVALKQIVYLELVEREYKRRKADADKAKLSEKSSNAQASSEADEQSGTAKKGRKGKKGAAAAAAAAAAVEADAAAKENDIEQVAGNAEDEIGDVVGDVREKELLFGPRSLLALFGSVVAQICSSPKSFANDYLRKASVLSMCKFMCVSSEYCEAHLPLLLSILTHSGDAVVRSNIVIALGDIAVSFGSLVDENSERLYAGLADRDLGVKKHTLMVLTHLILNGMIKVKGQLGEMAKCIEDDEERVSDLAKLFFSELATKENAVYNNLPDIISHLSIGKHAVDEETFASTMRYIFQFIDKERQAENVVEKLCQR